MFLRNMFQKSPIAEIAPQEAHDRQKNGAIIIDVRESYEWQEGHIPGARHIPLGSLAQHFDKLDKTKEIVTVCRSGHRSMMAANALQRAGFTQVSNMSGGMVRWMLLQLPIKR